MWRWPRPQRETRSLLENLQIDELDGVTLSSALRILAGTFSAQGLEVAYTDGLAGERLPAKVEAALFGVRARRLIMYTSTLRRRTRRYRCSG